MPNTGYRRLEISEPLLTGKADMENHTEADLQKKKMMGKLTRLTNVDKVLMYIACFGLSFLIAGFGYGLSVSYAELNLVFSVSRSEVALIQSLFIGINYVGGIFWSRPVTKYGAGVTVMIGASVGCLGIFDSSFTESIPLIIILVGALGGAAFGICLIVPYMMANVTFGKHRMVILSSITCATPLGQFVFTIILELLVAQYEWNGCFLVISGLLLNCFVFGLIIHFRDPNKYKRSNQTQHSSKEKIPGKENKETTLFQRHIFRDWKIWIFFVISLILPVTGATESRFYVDLLVLKGYTRETGSFMASFIGIANFSGRFLGVTTTLCAHFIRSIDHSIHSSLINAASHLMVVYLTGYWGLFSAAIINGLSYGFYSAHLPVIILDSFGKEKYASALATMNVMSGVGFFLSGVLGGSIQDLFGTYDALFFFACAGTVLVCILQLVIALSIRKVACFKSASSYENLP